MLKKLLSLLSRQEKRRGALVLGLVVVMALLETAGVASVMPFLSVLGNPEVVETNPVLNQLYAGLGFESVDAFLMALGAGAFALIVFSAAFRSLTIYAMNRWAWMRMHSLSERLLETYLRQPYAYFLNRHSGDMGKSILTETQQLQQQVIKPGLDALAYGVVVIAIITLLVVIDPVLAAGVAAVLGGMYALIYWGVRGFLDRIGRDRVRANQERFQAAGEALGGIKDIKLLGREHAYLSRFRGPSTRFAKHQATSQTLSQVPKFLIEAVAFGGIIALTLVLMATHGGATGGGLGEVLPVLGLYAFAGYRMLPAAQHVYQGLAKLRFGGGAVDAVYDDLHRRQALAEIRKQPPAPLVPQQVVALERVHYTYPNAPAPALQGIDLHIPVGSSVGLVGSTGAGKTTLVDVILGLLRPTEGAITVDGEPVTDTNLRAWQQALGYVPQEIFLTDASVAENIALGVPPERIDHEQVERCARMAQLHDFVVHEMPQQYETVVGERGVRLSGGQRQRIGIARALYHDPSVLVFDEATSALDNVTEKAVMEAIDALHHQKTIILIAHRLSTVRNCDQVVLLEKGQITAAGGFEELQGQSERFRMMATGTD
ncbi:MULTISPECIES: ABC transporter ATP-binding protein [Halorhodospira]|uniref:ABC transporter ATP-binding protein n=1 Tax=Halorhodospira TaxID=85108 RepID=UPI001EE97E75|nr:MULTISPECIES: ABC transporter ATP-binding protein [Halorhodospira]MCG5528473.1 ABC transporter ATP-binding protein/permease [Halorhodospira halophila]MCG5544522.1 ABC transporter ATP-binding protein/permease [Halorhodospira sp. 9628]